MRLLLVEDDKLLGQSMVTSLSRHGYTVDWVEKGSGVTSALKTEAFTAVILDLTLPISMDWKFCVIFAKADLSSQ